MRLEETVTVATSTTYTFSLYAKKDQLDEVLLYTSNFNSPSNNGYLFNLTDGTVSAWAGTPTHTPTIQDVGNGWYRCAITFTTDSVDATGALQIYVIDGGSSSVPLDGTSSILIYGAQFEQGSTPSSLIPTNGATVSRALETLTIPAANMPWPEPVVIGSEEFVAASATETSGVVQDGTNNDWTMTAAAVSNSAIAYDAGFSTNAGKVYLVQFEVYDYVSGSVCSRIQGVNGPARNANGIYSEVKTAIPTGDFIGISITSTSTLKVRNISVREINPLAVSIQMQGRMTYADTGIEVEVSMFDWRASGTIRIQNYVRTISGTGEFKTLIDARGNGGLIDAVSSDVDYYSPGVNVPFNIAARHGSTFINGAVDGVALTADTTPTALPDLSATDLNLGYDYMGTISMLRVWADDLADVGIAEATEPSEVPSLQLTFDNSETSFIIQDWEQ